MTLLNVLLGTAVVAVGFWLLWESISPIIVAGWAVAAAGLLWSQAKTVAAVWAWSTLLLGLESFTRPIILILRFRSESPAPSEQEMETIFPAVVLGLFSSVFWLTFSYGLFRRARGIQSDAASAMQPHRRARPVTKSKLER